eukprot:1160340-Pelagomonas_calceolata.AAC.6
MERQQEQRGAPPSACPPAVWTHWASPTAQTAGAATHPPPKEWGPAAVAAAAAVSAAALEQFGRKSALRCQHGFGAASVPGP